VAGTGNTNITNTIVAARNIRTSARSTVAITRK
jgi:hypothetical protein